MFLRPGLNQVFFVKKNVGEENKVFGFVLMHTYLHCYY